MTERLGERSDPGSGNGKPHPNGRGHSTADRLAELRAEIAHTRAELGETVQALAAKADVKARVRGSVHDVSDRGREMVQRCTDAVRRRPAPLAAALSAAILIVALVRWRRNR
jgi:hypothetical protein